MVDSAKKERNVMMKRFQNVLLILLSVLLCVGLLTACAPEAGTDDSITTTTAASNDVPDPTPDETPKPPAPVEADHSIAKAREAEAGTVVEVTGVVARITYSYGPTPAGLYLVDHTGSIYIYDAAIAAKVEIGHSITVSATRANWILDSEKANAEKFGYQGCIQLENATLVEQDTSTHEFDKSWIPTATVRDILEAPVTEPITTTIYKVNALVKKEQGTGFVNYYFYDLDGETRSYTYTQCNGKDFAWLDAFDGKICTVYLSPINAKSTAADCFFRFLPIEVIDEGFTFDVKDAPKFAVDYYGIPQFEAVYTGDPAQELMTTVDSELLGFEGVALSYTSDNAAVASVTDNLLHCNAVGEANITVKAVYNGNEYTATVKITVKANEEYDTITVKEAQESALDEEVTVRGIVGPSLANQVGFYLIDETGTIAVLVNASVFEGLSIGDEIVLRGTRALKVNDNVTCAGQTHIKDGEILANYHGKNEYSTASFITGKTVKDIYDLDDTEDHTTEVYVVTGTLEFTSSGYSKNLHVVDGNTRLRIYCSNAEAQFACFAAYNGQTVTIEIAPCNWNSKDYYCGCILAIHLEDGTVIYGDSNFMQ